MKNSKYCGSKYAPDPFFCIERLEKQIAALTADKRILKAAIEYYKDDAVVMKAQIDRLETEVKEKDAIISTRTEVVHQLQDALSVRDRQIATLTAEKDKLKEALKKLAKFRSECHAYDLDMGNPLREFGDEEWDMVEQIAQAALLCEILF